MKYDAIVVLGAVMVWDGNLKKWTFPDIVTSYAGKLVLGDRRALAAAYLADKTTHILVTGGSDTHPETGEVHSRAVELAYRIVEMGAPYNKVQVIGQIGSSHTQGNVENLIAWLKTRPGINKVAILSPLFQYHRARMMFDLNLYFKEAGINLEWLIVETILMKEDLDFIDWFEKVYTSPDALVCLEMEVQGIKALRDKNYAPKS